MRRRRWVFLPLALAAVLIIGSLSSVFAQTSQDKLSSINQQLSTAKNQLTQSQEEADQLANQLGELDRQIYATENGINQTKGEIQATLEQIAVKIQELEVKNEEIITQNDNLNARLRTMYMNGEVGYLEVLLDSGSFKELMTNIDMISKIYEQDEEFMQLLKEQYDQLEATKKQLEDLKAELSYKQSLLEEQKGTLEVSRSEVQRLRNDVQYDIDAQNALIDELNAAASQISSLIKSSQSTTTKFVGGTFCLPAPSYTRVSSYYGYRIHPITGTRKLHTGIDFAAPANTPCVAAAAGTVTYAGWYSGYGYAVVIDHGGGISTLYGHNNSLLVSRGDTVTQGQQIAKIGSTGNSTGPHCHFEVRVNGSHTNPAPYLNGSAG